MTDLILDTGALVDLLAQYFQSPDRDRPHFVVSVSLPSHIVSQIHRIIDGDGRNVIAASTLGFVELARKWDELVRGRFHPYQLAAFLQTPPDWFVVEPMDADLVEWFGQVPPYVQMPDGMIEPIEWTDAVHIATMLSRDQGSLVTTDRRLIQVLRRLKA